MAKKAKGKHRLDKFYHLAKEQGYRSRAAFKLIQLNRKYNFLGNARAVLDLCAAPGGWLQVAAKNMPVSSLIIGVDLAPIKPIRGVKSFIGDITTQKCRQQLRKESGGSRMDCVLHDGAPNVGGAWASEAYSQAALTLEALRLAVEFLAPGGYFVTKIFRSKDYTSLLYAFNQLFDRVEATKPAASRNASAEIFVVCGGFKAPAKIDPRLLEPKHLFSDVVELAASAGPDALLKHKVKASRHREGYADGISTTHRSATAAAFVATNAPVAMLGQYTRLALDGPESQGPVEGYEGDAAALAARVGGHPATSAEIRVLCGDLQVLGRSEFKQLLKWRQTIRKELDIERKAAAGAAAAATAAGTGGAVAGDSEEDEEAAEAKVLAEMAGVKERLEHERKREVKRRRELKKKARVRAAAMAASQGLGDEEAQASGLFSLADVQGKGAAAVVGDAVAPSAAELEALDAPSSSEGSGEEEEDLDTDEEAQRYDEGVDEAMEEAYQSYLQRQKRRAAAAAAAAEAAAAKKRRRLGMAHELDGSDEEAGGDGEGGGGGVAPAGVGGGDDEDEAGGGLLVSLDSRRAGRPTSAAAVADQWFSQELFSDPSLQAALAVDDEAGGGATRRTARSGGGGGAADEAGDEDEVDAAFIRDAKKARREAAAAGGGGAERGGLEVVPLADDEGSDSGDDDEYDALDDNAKVEIRALAKRMLRGRERHNIVEAAYNRYNFHDDGLPRWFEEDEQKHMRPIIELTKPELDDARAALRAIDARPIKKVAEARARKRKRLAVRLTAARHKAEALSNQEDVPLASKMREIEKVMAKARASGKGKKDGKKDGKRGGGKAGGRKGPPLDPRSRADKRQVNTKAKKKAAVKQRRKTATKKGKK